MSGPMGKRNYLIEGVSGTGKSSVCQELRRRGYAAVDGDNELAYQGDPQTSEKTGGFGHEHHIWDVEKVKALVSNKDDEATFFCGASRNFNRFIDLFDGVFILPVVCGLRIKLSCRVRWPAPVQANTAGVATQEVGAVATTHANSAAA